MQQEVTDIFKKTASLKKNVYYFDYNQFYSDNFALFYDLRHLNAVGNKLVTERLAKDMQETILNNDNVELHN
jgi:hypothetical protein